MALVIKEISSKSILTKSNLPIGGYSANPYVGCPHACKYCYASFMKRFTNHPEPWGTFLDVKFWPEIRCPKKYAGQKIFIGSVTDPYHPLEADWGRTRALLQQLEGSGAEISIATKSDLVLRDLELIRTFPNARVSWSINTLDESFRSDMDSAVSLERRWAAMKTFRDAGIRTTCFISPIFPGITDVPAIVRRARSCCDLIWLENLNLRGSFKSTILEYIQQKRPELLPIYRKIYCCGDLSYWQALDAALRQFSQEEGLSYLVDDDSLRRPQGGPPILVNYFYHEKIRLSAKRRD